MRVLVLTDIHSNLVALDAVLAAAGPVDETWVLGDTVGYGPEPDGVVARLRERAAVAVMGNHDAATLGLMDTDVFNDDARAAVAWTVEHIGAEAREWLAGLPQRIERGDYTLVHGTPRDPLWEYCFSVPVARRALDACATSHCLVGHTHIPLLFRQREGRIETLAPSDGSSVVIDEARLVMNPGGVGQPRDGDPRACALILEMDAETGQSRATWQRVEYPVEPVQERMRELGLPERLARRLEIGV
jgi:diadenosine tetraphosphatase ApaH/serine/threonine PP2A family protein phosphatase